MAEATVRARNEDATIHDIGYRRYEGRLLGAAGAWRSVYWQGFRAMFGFGRSVKSKIVPIFVVVVTMLPALGMLTAASATGGALPIQYGALVMQQLLMYVLFVGAQTPEILSRDQQDKLLPLVLTRHVTRDSYATARLAAAVSALFLVTLAPSLLLYAGEIGGAANPAAAFEKSGHHFGPILVQSAVSATMLGSLSAAIAAFTPRRSIATAAIIGLFLVLAAVAAGLDDLAGVSRRTADFVDPLRNIGMQAMLLHGETTRSMELNPPRPLWNYVTFNAALGTLGICLTLFRIRRLRL